MEPRHQREPRDDAGRTGAWSLRGVSAKIRAAASWPQAILGAVAAYPHGSTPRVPPSKELRLVLDVIRVIGKVADAYTTLRANIDAGVR